jgi:hypothetical protein
MSTDVSEEYVILPLSGSNKPSKILAWKRVANSLAWLIRSRRLRWYIPPKPRLTFKGLHGVISWKILLFVFLLSEPWTDRSRRGMCSSVLPLPSAHCSCVRKTSWRKVFDSPLWDFRLPYFFSPEKRYMSRSMSFGKSNALMVSPIFVFFNMPVKLVLSFSSEDIYEV